MKVFKFLLSLIFTAAIVYGLNTKFGQIPPLGKFLDPFHGFWKNSFTGEYSLTNLELEGLKDEVVIYYDSLHIPHIFAQNEDDLYFAQGFITAKDRLWQMDISTRAAAGRLSEIMGPAVIDFDRLQRRRGMVFGAENSFSILPENPEVFSAIESYSLGVNSYINSLEYEDLNVEYKLLDFKPEEWQPLKTVLLFMNMSNTLNRSDKDIQNTNFYNLYGLELLDLLYPDFEGVENPVVDNPGGWNFDPIIMDSDSIPFAIPDGLYQEDSVDDPDPNVGSNNWAISGSKTKSGYPILANDPHLELNLPSIWYVVHLNAPGINTMGSSLPASPFVILGWNDSIAWGSTNAQRDLVDYYKITFQDDSRDRYLLDDTWVPTQKVIEEIKVKGSESFYDTVVYTNWGPIVYDKNFGAESERRDLAYRWISHDPTNAAMVFYKLNKAKNHEEYLAAINTYDAPAQNLVFASIHGDIAIKVQGKYPVRRKNEGRFVLDGTKSSSGWQAFIPDDQNAHEINPERGFVQSANQYPADSTYPYYITARDYEAFRNRRIYQVLDSLDQISVEDVMKLQNDNFNMEASEALPILMSHINSFALNTEEKQAYEILKAWDYFNEPESEGATYYEIWWGTFYQMLYDEIRTSEVSLRYPSDFVTIQLIRDTTELDFYDRLETPENESLSDLVKLSFSEAVERALRWKESKGTLAWASFKGTEIRHLIQQLEPFHVQVFNGGNRGIVNATSERNGPSWRMIVSLEPQGIKAWGVYPGGQSGNPGSPYYSDYIPVWESGKYFRMDFRKDYENTEYRRQKLTPKQ